MWGIIPAAGRGSRIQPLAFSKELLPVGSRRDGTSDRPLAVSEYLVERMLLAGVDKLCFVISPGKSDILEYYGGRVGAAHVCYAVQDSPRGLCDALFRALPFIHDDERVCVGLPDTVWFPQDGFLSLSSGSISFLLFPVANPALFDAVCTDDGGNVLEIEVKVPAPKSSWIWGAFSATGKAMHDLHSLWRQPERGDEYIGTLINAYIAAGGQARGVRAGRAYVDVGTLHGFREATRLLEAVNLLTDVDLLRMDERTPTDSHPRPFNQVPNGEPP